MTDDTRFPASEKVQGQRRSRRAYAEFMEQLDQFEWWQDYKELRGRGWDWRKAAYIAWAASPAQSRNPPTQEELATEILGLASDRTIRKWKEKHADLDDQIAEFQAGPLFRHRRDVYNALVRSASKESHQNHADRKLFLEMVGDYSRDRVYDPEMEPAEPEHIQQQLDQVYGDDPDDDLD